MMREVSVGRSRYNLILIGQIGPINVTAAAQTRGASIPRWEIARAKGGQISADPLIPYAAFPA